MSTMDRAGIAHRLRELLGRPDQGDLARTAARLGVEEAALRASLEEPAPRPAVAVMAAVIRTFGVDPTWLLTGTYDASTHRTAMESEDVVAEIRGMIGENPDRHRRATFWSSAFLRRRLTVGQREAIVVAKIVNSVSSTSG